MADVVAVEVVGGLEELPHDRSDLVVSEAFLDLVVAGAALDLLYQLAQCLLTSVLEDQVGPVN